MSQTREAPVVILPKKNVTGGGTALAAHTLVKLDTSTADGIVAAAAASDIVFGVTLAAIADAAFGDVGVVGRFRVLAGAGGFTQGVRVMPTTGGAAIPATGATGANYAIAGVAETAGTSGDVGEVYFSGPGQVMQGT